MKRNLLIGCVAALAIGLIFVAALILVVPRVWHRGMAMMQTAMAESARMQQVEAAFTPPGPPPAVDWMPAQISEWKAAGPQQPVASLPKLHLERAGVNGVYEKGGEKMEVTVMPANSLEKEALEKHAEDALARDSHSHFTQSVGERIVFKDGGGHATCLWWIKDYLLIFQTDGPTPPETFAESYLEAASKTPAPEPPADGKP